VSRVALQIEAHPGIKKGKYVTVVGGRGQRSIVGESLPVN
jgi:hypothetical protein